MNLDDYIFNCPTCYDSQQVRVPALHGYAPCPDCATKEKPEPARSLWGAPKRETPTPFDNLDLKKTLVESIIARQADSCKFNFQHALMSDGSSKPNSSEVTLADAMVLSRLCLQFGQTFRVTQDAAGRPESDTTHSLMLALLAGELAPREAVPMDRFVVAALALIHDIAEVYAGDTNTIRQLDRAGIDEKAEREKAALRQIRDELAGFPWILELIDRYERQICNESRFVKYLDKVLPGLTHHDNGAIVLRQLGFNAQSLRERNDMQDADLHHRFPEFTFTRLLLQKVYQHIENVLWRSPISRPEPPPTGNGELVTPPLLAAIKDHPDLHALVVARDVFGRSKYGTGLRCHNGRDPLEDARQELGDLLQYLWQALMEGRDISNQLDMMARAITVLQETNR